MLRKNPFMISFGRIPIECITRDQQKEQIINTFTLPPVTDQIFIITGLRGSGKTVLLSMVTEELSGYNDWIIIRLNASDDMSANFYSELYYALKSHHVKISAELSIPKTGINISVQNDAPERTLQSKVEDLLKKVKDKSLHVLIAVDEVSKSSQMRTFAQMFQTMISENLPVYFLGTGIPENIEKLADVKDLTFLYRAPRITLGPLDEGAIMERYQKIFSLDILTASTMARLTKGYSFAFQALGYTYWNHMPVNDLSDILSDYDRLLGEASYTKLWKEMSENDRRICLAIAESNDDRVKSIREKADMSSSLFSIYRQRLHERDIINTDTYGKITFTLPRFTEFIRTRALLYKDI